MFDAQHRSLRYYEARPVWQLGGARFALQYGVVACGSITFRNVVLSGKGTGVSSACDRSGRRSRCAVVAASWNKCMHLSCQEENAACIIHVNHCMYSSFPFFYCSLLYRLWLGCCRSGDGLCRQASRHKPCWEGYRLDGALLSFFFFLVTTLFFCSACVISMQSPCLFCKGY